MDGRGFWGFVYDGSDGGGVVGGVGFLGWVVGWVFRSLEDKKSTKAWAR